jgi:hypothetical protein
MLASCAIGYGKRPWAAREECGPSELRTSPARHHEETDDMHEEIKKTEARQGITDHGVRYVLAISLTLVLIAVLVIYFGMM